MNITKYGTKKRKYNRKTKRATRKVKRKRQRLSGKSRTIVLTSKTSKDNQFLSNQISSYLLKKKPTQVL